MVVTRPVEPARRTAENGERRTENGIIYMQSVSGTAKLSTGVGSSGVSTATRTFPLEIPVPTMAFAKGDGGSDAATICSRSVSVTSVASSRARTERGRRGIQVPNPKTAESPTTSIFETPCANARRIGEAADEASSATVIGHTETPPPGIALMPIDARPGGSALREVRRPVVRE